MTLFPIPTSRCVLVEFGRDALHLLDAEEGLDLPLTRSEMGRLTSACVENLLENLRAFARKRDWPSSQTAVCAVEARGVSLRRLTVPMATSVELPKLLLLQIEADLPLAPTELAWGYRVLPQPTSARAGAKPEQEILLAAMRKELLAEYVQVLSACGLKPVFTVAALARDALCPDPPDSYAVLDLETDHAELLSVDRGCPNSIRTVTWNGIGAGSRSVEPARALATQSQEPTSPLPISPPTTETPGSQALVVSDVNVLAQSIQKNWSGRRLYLTGTHPELPELALRLNDLSNGGIECRAVPASTGSGCSAAVLGLRQLSRRGSLPLILQNSGSGEKRTPPARSLPWKWLAAVFVLALVSLGLRYAEAIIQTPRLAQRVAEMKTAQQKLPNLDRELDFLRYLRTNQPPYLTSLAALAEAAPPGTRIDNLSMNRRGDLSLRATMGGGQQVVDFRAKLAASGLFNAVVVDEQTPSSDRQKLSVRITGQWKQTSDGPTRVGELGISRATNALSSPPAQPSEPGTNAINGQTPPVTNTSARPVIMPATPATPATPTTPTPTAPSTPATAPAAAPPRSLKGE